MRVHPRPPVPHTDPGGISNGSLIINNLPAPTSGRNNRYLSSKLYVLWSRHLAHSEQLSDLWTVTRISCAGPATTQDGKDLWSLYVSPRLRISDQWAR